MKSPWKLLALLFCLAACAIYYPIEVLPGDSAALSLHKLHIDVPADGRDRKALRTYVRDALKRELPWLIVVDHPALADATLSWRINTGQMCVDCGDMAFSGYSWQGELRAYHGSGLVVFSGSSQSQRCCPDHAFLRQFTRYLRAHAGAPLALGVHE